ncbi:MAG: hypothetical protein ABI234_20435, partial [Ktedonobacteraceae bacterium]
GSGGGPGGPGGPIAAIAPVAPVAAIVPVSLGSVRNESVALICEVNIFSINVNVINLLASLTQVCIKG